MLHRHPPLWEHAAPKWTFLVDMAAKCRTAGGCRGNACMQGEKAVDSKPAAISMPVLVHMRD